MKTPSDGVDSMVFYCKGKHESRKDLKRENVYQLQRKCPRRNSVAILDRECLAHTKWKRKLGTDGERGEVSPSPSAGRWRYAPKGLCISPAILLSAMFADIM